MTDENEYIKVRRLILENVYRMIGNEGDAKNLLKLLLEHDGETPGLRWEDDPTPCSHCGERPWIVKKAK